jgi:hypothetical protein
MSVRYYLSAVIGDGLSPATAFRPALTDSAPGVSWGVTDGRADAATTAPGVMLVIADVSAAQHTALVADARITYLPFEDALGNLLTLADAIGSVSAANRTLCQNALEAQNVPMQGLTLSNTLADLVRRCVRRFLLRQLLTSDDFTQGLDTLVSAMPATQRQHIAAKLQAYGFDTSVIAGTDTIREALRKLAAQGVGLFGAQASA